MELILKNGETIPVNYVNNLYSFADVAQEEKRSVTFSILEAGPEIVVDELKTMLEKEGNTKDFRLKYEGGEMTFDGLAIATVCEEISYGRRTIILGLQ